MQVVYVVFYLFGVEAISDWLQRRRSMARNYNTLACTEFLPTSTAFVMVQSVLSIDFGLIQAH